MIGFLQLFLPSIVSELIVEHKREEQIVTKIFRYLFFVLLNNMIVLAGITLIKGSISVVQYANKYSQFLIKYLVISVLVSVLTGYICKLIYENKIHIHIFNKKIIETFSFHKLTDYALIIICLVLIIMTVIRCNNNNLWGDEAFTIRMVKGSWGDIFNLRIVDPSHPPLYYLIIKFFCIPGGNYFWYHFISVIPYICIMILSITVFKKRFGRKTSLLMMLLSGLST